MNILKLAVLVGFCGASLLAAQNATDYFPTSELKQLSTKLAAKSKKDGAGFASETLTHYGNHLTMLAYRSATGSSELHMKDADVFMIVDGGGSLITGGKLLNGKTAQPNEIRGSGIEGGKTEKISVGEVVHIQPNTPHQIILAPGQTITYFVVKVTE